MRSRRTRCPAALLLLLLAAGLFAGGARLRRDNGAVSISRLPDTGETLYLPESAPPENTAPSVLLLGGHPGRGGEVALALELTRRGLLVLSNPDPAQAAESWDRLLSLPQVWKERAGVIVLGPESEAALSLSPSPKTVVLLGGSLPEGPAAETAQNVFAVPDAPPEDAAKAAFLRLPEGQAPEDRMSGVFCEGTGRLCLTASGPAWRDREVLARLFDWLGSSLGHRIEVADTDQIFRRWEALSLSGALCTLAGAALLCTVVFRKKPGAQHGTESGVSSPCV